MTALTPQGYRTVNSFIITRGAKKLIPFLEAVFGAQEDVQAHTLDSDGLLLHSELTIGDSRVMVAESKKGWPFTPSLLQIYVEDVEQVLAKAEELGARVVTRPTEMYGDLFSRFVDPWDNLWWVYQHQEKMSWEEPADDGSWNTESSELTYIHDSLLETMKDLGKKRIEC